MESVVAKRQTGMFPGAAKPRSTTAKPRRVSAATFIAQSRAVSSEEKAIFHNILGVGKRGTKRPFFDLNKSDEGALRDSLEKAVAMRLKAAQ